MRTFIDTSAFAKRFVEETGSKEVDDILLDAAELAISVICVPELLSGMNRRIREKGITKNQYSKIKHRLSEEIIDIDIIQMTDNVLKNTVSLLEQNILRAMDAIHIACALEWDADIFLTSDKRQFKAAKKVLKKSVFI